jgi:hypothetical protein
MVKYRLEVYRRKLFSGPLVPYIRMLDRDDRYYNMYYCDSVKDQVNNISLEINIRYAHNNIKYVYI